MHALLRCLRSQYRSLRASAVSASLLLLAATASGQAPLQPGSDRYATMPGTQVTFGTDEIPPLPPDFFNPGSEPFFGTILFVGSPLPSTLDNADTVIQRTAPAPLPGDNTAANVPIELVQLSLQSAGPILINGQPYDVRLQNQPAQPSTGFQLIVRDDLMSGTFAPNLQLRPQFTFINLTNGVTHVFSPPILLPIQSPPSSPQPQWGQLPYAAPSPNITPNMFPRSAFRLESPFGSYIHLLEPARSQDCNQNLIADLIEIADNPRLDSDSDGILDACQINAGVTQCSYPDLVGGFASRFSSAGQLAVRFRPAFFDIFWCHANADGAPAVLNAPIIAQNNPLEPHVVHIPILLTLTAPNTQLFDAPFQIAITPDPIPVLPPSIVRRLPVFEHVISPGELDPAPVPIPVVNTSPVPFIVPFIPLVNWETVARREVPGVNEATNHCAPGAAARSLDWLDDILCLDLPATNDQASEMYDKLRNADHMMTTEASGTASAEKMHDGVKKFITDKMLADCLTSELVVSSNPAKAFDALKDGCDVVGFFYWLNANGTRNGGHAITIVGGVKCGDNVVLDYRDDVHGTDTQGDGKADKDDTKKAGFETDGAGGHSIKGLAKNQWGGFIKICPTRKCQIDSLAKWILGDLASGGVTPGLRELALDLTGGFPPTPADRANLTNWSTRAYDLSIYLDNHLQACPTPILDSARAASADLRSRTLQIQSSVISYLKSADPASLNPVLALTDPLFSDAAALIAQKVDCNSNGIDDLLDIALGALDSNGDCIIDSCQCTADFDNNDAVQVADIFSFLNAWFAQFGLNEPPHLSADFNNDGSVQVSDIFSFLNAWFAQFGNCP